MKKETHKFYNYGAFSFWPVDLTLQEATNVVRWNPLLAISWMEEMRNRLTSQIHINAFNKAATYINNFLDKLETYKYYDSKEVWGQFKPTRLALEEDMIISFDEQLKILLDKNDK